MYLLHVQWGKKINSQRENIKILAYGIKKLRISSILNDYKRLTLSIIGI